MFVERFKTATGTAFALHNTIVIINKDGHQTMDRRSSFDLVAITTPPSISAGFRKKYINISVYFNSSYEFIHDGQCFFIKELNEKWQKK
jgi:hypothetical protein